MTINEMIGLRIKTMRLSRRMTQADLAKAIGQSPSSITMYESGKRKPDFETLEALADVFNVSLASIVTDETRTHDPDESVSLLVSSYNALPAAAGHPVTIRCHDFRHTYCTMLVDAGVPLKQAMAWLGHADEKMILRVYDHVHASRTAAAVDHVEHHLADHSPVLRLVR